MAYLVLSVHSGGQSHGMKDWPVLSLLDRASLEVMLRRMVPLVRQCLRRGAFVMLYVFRFLESGMFCSGVRCKCRAKRVCHACRVYRLEQSNWSRFVLLVRYRDVYPFGRSHWWTGVTDAVGEITSVDERGPWLPKFSCICDSYLWMDF